jgi:hypothetical protein
MSTYSSATAGTLVQLAVAALQDLTQSWLALPPGWSAQWVFPGRSVAGAPAGQGFYASGTIAQAPATVLALGVPWGALCSNLYSQNAYFEGVISPMYGSKLRSWIWEKRPASGAFYVTGIGVGGVLAQLAAVDLRLGNTGPQQQSAPRAGPACYVFSTPLAGDRKFADFYQNSVADSYAVSLQSGTITVDCFPTIPSSDYGDSNLSDSFYTAVGSARPTSTPLPMPDDPWVERTGNLYLSALGGTPAPPPTQPGSIATVQPGFDQTLAYVLARLSSAVYSQFQHPNLPLDLPQPYTWVSSLASTYPLQPATYNPRVPAAPALVCSIFSSPTAVVISFRGMVTWAEIIAVQGNCSQVLADFLPGANGRSPSISQGAYNVYADAAAGTTLRAALVQALNGNLLAGKQLYLTGHDFGGVLATIAAYDLVLQHRQSGAIPAPIALYTFGSQPAGDYVFAADFNGAFPASYQVMRPGDCVAGVNPSSAYQQVNFPVSLLGVPPNDDAAAHSITSYIQLLNPSGFTPPAAIRTDRLSG